MKLFTTLIILLFSQFLTAQIPQTLSYQGLLISIEGESVQNGLYEVQFALYNQPESGSPLWTENQSVSVVEGVFGVNLGNVIPLDIPFNEQYFLGISIEDEPELVPRYPLTASAYSLRTRSIDDGQVVRSINTLRDNITLQAGENIELNEDENTITISAQIPDGGGTISNVIAGDGLTGGGTEGAVTLSIAESGITENMIANGAVTASKIASNAVTETKIENGAVTPSKFSSIPAASVTIANTINVNNTSSTIVPFESKSFDIGNIHNPATNSSRLVAPIDGIYQISAMVTWSSNENGIRQISIRRNNVIRMGDTRTAAGVTSQSMSGLLLLNKDDFVDLLVFQDSGTTLELISGAPIKFEMYWVAPAP